jgi:hypothetical protein
MSAEEVVSFLGQERVVTCATLGPRGWPHLMPLWYVLRALPSGPTAPITDPQGADGPDRRIWAWTYAASQTARNLQRDARATLQVEAGEQYRELRGVMLECEVVLHRDLETVAALGREIFTRHASPAGEPEAGGPAHDPLPAEVGAMVDRQAAKRVALEFVELRRASWDHRKLGGTY